MRLPHVLRVVKKAQVLLVRGIQGSHATDLMLHIPNEIRTEKVSEDRQAG